MNSRLMKMLLAVALSSAGMSIAARGQSAESPLTNSSVIKLARAGFREKTLIAIIRSRPARFDLAPERLIELKKNGVSEKVILAMLGRDEANAMAADIFGASDDDFFKDDDTARGTRRGGASNADPNETNIFGSSGGSNARVRSRGADGDGQENTQTNGSATVRILRTPVEGGGGGASPKLEKTPTLRNDSVVEMVEAGFSEGTIIRRIEQSPVEFDLAPTKLAELRRRRVTEPILVAMRAAMGDEADAAKPEK